MANNGHANAPYLSIYRYALGLHHGRAPCPYSLQQWRAIHTQQGARPYKLSNCTMT